MNNKIVKELVKLAKILTAVDSEEKIIGDFQDFLTYLPNRFNTIRKINGDFGAIIESCGIMERQAKFFQKRMKKAQEEHQQKMANTVVSSDDGLDESAVRNILKSLKVTAKTRSRNVPLGIADLYASFYEIPIRGDTLSTMTEKGYHHVVDISDDKHDVIGRVAVKTDKSGKSMWMREQTHHPDNDSVDRIIVGIKRYLEHKAKQQ